MMMTNRVKPALAVTAMLLLMTSATAFGKETIPAAPEKKMPALTEQIAAITLEGTVEYVELEGGYYQIGEWSLMGDIDFSAYAGKSVTVTGKEFDGMSIRQVKSLVVSQISLKEEAAPNQNGVISLDGKVSYVDLEGGYYMVGEWSLMGDVDFSAYDGKNVTVTGKEFDGMSIRMVKSLVVDTISLKDEAKGEARGDVKGEKAPTFDPVVIDGLTAMEGVIEYLDLEGGFYAIDGVGLIGDENLFKAFVGQRALVRGKQFDGISTRQVPQIEVTSVMLPLTADRAVPEAITVNGNKVPAGQEAVMVDGTLYLPLRHVVEAAGGKVQWDPQERAVVVTMPDRMAYFKVGEIEAEMNENNVRYLTRNMIKMEKAPVIIKGRTMISADAATYILGLYEVAGTDAALDLAPVK